MPEHRTASREEWEAARADLLAREKEHTRRGDELAQARRELPWLRVEKAYTLQTQDGPKTLAELFAGRSQLVVYHFMFGPTWQAGCAVCSSIADSFDPVLPHLGARDVTMIAVSHAPLERLLAYRERMGWSFTWASSYESDFNSDYRYTRTVEEVAPGADRVPPHVQRFIASCGTDPISFFRERPGLSVFAREGDDVYLTYATTARGLEPLMTYYEILDRVPHGRDEHEPIYQSWIVRHDEFPAAA
jgi:predicted dithiol-disulfide oxidoreductase (DUF899 family)